MQSRRLAYGELSEIFGQKTYNIDDFMKRIDLKRLSSVSLQYQSQRTQEALESYASGVNSWLNLINKGYIHMYTQNIFLIVATDFSF